MKKGIFFIAFMLAVFVFCGYIYRKLYLGSSDPEPDSNEIIMAYSTGENVKHLQRKINDLIKESMHSSFPLMDGDSTKSYRWITDTINVSGVFDAETENALHAITGEYTIMVTDINSLKLPMQK
ncbi:MAG TPA: hypothetical protein PKU77_07670 [Ferruginibacter sp.]|nr:hypothetical protein [Ferruginibacter sp.]